MTVPAHDQTRTLTETIWYPEHAHRTASVEYRKVHYHLVYELDEPCWICGVRQSQLPAGAHNETHHVAVEWALANAVDPKLVAADFETDRILAAKADDAWLRNFLDSEGNLLVLCSAHHRHGFVGIHSVTYPAWVVQRWERTHDVAVPPPSTTGY